VQLVLQARSVLLAQRALQDTLDQQVLLVLLVRLEQQVLLALLDMTAQPAPQVLQVYKGRLALQVQLDMMDQLVQLVYRVQMGTNTLLRLIHHLLWATLVIKLLH
jgi:hypothetical protein